MTELSPEAKKLFELSRRSFSPREERIAKVGAVIAAQVGLAVAASTSASAATAVGKAAAHGAAWLSTTKIVGAVFVVASVGVSAIAVPRFLGRTEPAAVTSAPRVAALRAPSTEANGVPAAPTIRLEALEAAHASPGGSRRVEVEPAPQESDAPSTPATEKVLLEETAEADGTEERGAPPAASKAEEPTKRDPLMDEIALVRSARAALDAGNAARTLALLSQHAAQYPRGALGEERLALRVLALCRLGRVAEARASAKALERISPRSPHLERVRSSCAGER